ncbi:MAG: hypothetical protein LBN12_08690 [Clostridiales Family XIII bacterium]|jgi:hypothetical protein|nr:hypothetical protein [Clostridiales Family XIII bacterium]
MNIISVKIETTYISISQERREKNLCTVLVSHRVYLPGALIGEKGRARPDGFAKILHEALKEGAIPGKDLALYLGAKTAFFRPYAHGQGIDEAAKKKRQQGEEDRLFENLDERPLTARYDFGNERPGLASGAIIASEESFVRTLIQELKTYGYTVVLVSSSLIAYAEALRPIVVGAGRVIAVDADKSGLKAVCFENGEPTALAGKDYTESPADALTIAGAVPLMVDLTGDETKILITGFLSADQGLTDALDALPGVTYCRPLSFELKGAKKTIAFRDRLKGREALLPGVFSAIGADPRSPHLPDLIRKEAKEGRRRNTGLIALCVVTLFIAAIACAVPALNLFMAQRTLDENKAIFLNEGNAAAGEKLADRRELTMTLSELGAGQSLLPKETVSYASVIEELKIGLLMDADIEQINFNNGSGALIDFTLKDEKEIENFDEMKAIIATQGRMEIIEPAQREETTADKKTITHIQIRVLAGNELR